MSDAAGDQINSTVNYYPFGTTRSGSVPTDRLFTGQRLDDTGLYFYNARYYEPGIGKFLSPDSSGPDLFNPQSLNKYSYCFNNPLKYNDPSGKWPNWSNIGKAISKGFQTAVNVVKENIDVVHTVLDVAGMIPGVGEAFDAVNGVIYAAEGDAFNAGLSFAACVPVFGTAATGVKLVGKTVDKVAGLVQAAKKVDTVFYSGGSSARKAAEKFASKNGGLTLSMTQTGEALDEITKGMNWKTEARPLWAEISQAWASSATGPAHVFINKANFQADSIWQTIELPELLKTRSYEDIIYHYIR